MKEQRKTSRFYIRLTEDEYNNMKEKAEESDVSMSAYVRYCALKKAHIIQTSDLCEKLNDNGKKLEKVGNNFNSLIKMAHSSPEALSNDLWKDAILEHLKAIRELTEKYENLVGKMHIRLADGIKD